MKWAHTPWGREREPKNEKGTINMRSLVFNELQRVFSSLKSLKCLLCHFSALHKNHFHSVSASVRPLCTEKDSCFSHIAFSIVSFPSDKRMKIPSLISMRMSHTQTHYKGGLMCVCVTREENLVYTLHEINKGISQQSNWFRWLLWTLLQSHLRLVEFWMQLCDEKSRFIRKFEIGVKAMMSFFPLNSHTHINRGNILWYLFAHLLANDLRKL